MNLPSDWSFVLLQAVEQELRRCSVCDTIRIADRGHRPRSCVGDCGCEITLSVVEGVVKQRGRCESLYSAEIMVQLSVCRPQPDEQGYVDPLHDRGAARESAMLRNSIVGAIVGGLRSGRIKPVPSPLPFPCEEWAMTPWGYVEDEGTCATWRMLATVAVTH